MSHYLHLQCDLVYTYISMYAKPPFVSPSYRNSGIETKNGLEMFICRDTIVHVHYAMFLLHACEHVHASLCHRLIKAYQEMKSR